MIAEWNTMVEAYQAVSFRVKTSPVALLTSEGYRETYELTPFELGFLL